MKSLLQIPPLIIVFITYQVLITFAPHILDRGFALLEFPLPSGADTYVPYSDLLIGISILLLLLQIPKSRKFPPTLFERLLSAGMLATLVIEMLFLRRGINGTTLIMLLVFALLLIMVLWVRKPKPKGYNLDGIH